MVRVSCVAKSALAFTLACLWLLAAVQPEAAFAARQRSARAQATQQVASEAPAAPEAPAALMTVPEADAAAPGPLPAQTPSAQEPDPWAAVMAQDIPPPAEREPDPLQEKAALAKEYDLRAAVERGLAANPQILSARSQLLSTDYQRKAALGEFGFKADVGYSYNYSSTGQRITGQPNLGTQHNTYAWTLSISQPLFTGFKLLSSYQRAKLAKDQAHAQLADVELSLVLSIQSNFLSLLQARMDVRSAEDAVARLESQLKVSQSFYDVGLRPKLDVLQSEVDLATAQQALLAARNQVNTQVARLNTLLDLPLDYPIHYVGDLTFVPFHQPLGSCLDQAYRLRPDLEIGRKSVEIAEKDVKIAASDFYPKVSADFNWSTQGDGPEASGSRVQSSEFSEWAAGASMSWNVFEWGATYNSYRSAKENVSKMEAELANLRLETQNQVKANILGIQTAQDRIRVGRKSLESSREGYRNALARYQAQVGTITEVLDAQSRVSESEAQLTQALTDYQTALANLYRSMGELNPGLAPR